jgi:hypothetical protein
VVQYAAMTEAPSVRAGALALRSGAAALAALVLGLVAVAGGCDRSKGPLGPPDSYVVYEPMPDAPAGDAQPRAMRPVPVEDPRAVPIHRGATDGFIGEMLRTDYLAKELLRSGVDGRPFSPSAQAQAGEPTVLVLAGPRAARSEEAALGVGIEVGGDPVSDPAFVQTAAGRIGRLVGVRVAGCMGAPAADLPRALIEGYALAMEVIGREWRVGEGPMGRVAPDAGTGTQRERFAAVRQNSFVFKPDSHVLRPASEIVSDPGVVAALIYRMAQAKGVGRKVASNDIYAPFVKDRVPPGVSPAAVLGPLRNFQVKLLTAWARATAAGHQPRDLIDLVTAYGEALPGERAEATRLFVITTYAATVKAGGVSAAPADAAGSLAELTTLAAEVAAGRKQIREAMHP